MPPYPRIFDNVALSIRSKMRVALGVNSSSPVKWEATSTLARQGLIEACICGVVTIMRCSWISIHSLECLGDIKINYNPGLFEEKRIEICLSQ